MKKLGSQADEGFVHYQIILKHDFHSTLLQQLYKFICRYYNWSK